MAVQVVPTLSAMAGVYQLSTKGGPASPRFGAYVELGRSGLPVSGYNPMTSKDVLGTIEALLDIEAERVVQDTADRWAEPLGLVDDVEMSVTVAFPGMWTDRLATEIEHRLLGCTWSQVLVWVDDTVSADAIVAQASAQLVRAAWTRLHGPPATLADAAGQEGLAAALGGTVEDGSVGRGDPAVAEALDVLGDDPSLGTMVAVLYGDDAAQALGWTPLGLDDHAGLRHCAATTSAALGSREIAELLRSRWSVGRARS
jgi:hypothetical protein